MSHLCVCDGLDAYSRDRKSKDAHSKCFQYVNHSTASSDTLQKTAVLIKCHSHILDSLVHIVEEALVF